MPREQARDLETKRFVGAGLPTRPLRVADLPALREVAALAEAEGFRFVRRFVADLVAGRIQLDGRCEFFLGTLVDGRLVAIGGITPDPYLDDSSAGRLRHLYVRPDARGAGVGRALVEHLELRAGSCYSLLRLRTDTPHAALFYEKLGYKPVESSSATHTRALSARHAHQQSPGSRD